MRSNIFLNTTFPSVNQAYLIAIQEEIQRNLVSTNLEKKPMIMLANKQQGSSFSKNQAHPFRRYLSYQNQNLQKKKLGIIYDNCGQKGLRKENYYRIIGFPPNFKS